MIVKEQEFKIENFEGPLDLLLHLIRKDKLDIMEISLIEVADQYIELIESSKEVNLDSASEYLLIAAMLLEIKARNMLKSEIFIEREEYEEDKHELLLRLIKYEKYKSLTDDMNEMYMNSNNLDKMEDTYFEFMESEAEKTIKIMAGTKKGLKKTMENILRRSMQNKEVMHSISLKRTSPEKRKEELQEKFRGVKNTSLLSIMGMRFDNYYIAVTLLVLLEMANSGLIFLKQTDDFTDINIKVLK